MQQHPCSDRFHLESAIAERKLLIEEFMQVLHNQRPDDLAVFRDQVRHHQTELDALETERHSHLTECDICKDDQETRN
jgi:hypothetical protein